MAKLYVFCAVVCAIFGVGGCTAAYNGSGLGAPDAGRPPADLPRMTWMTTLFDQHAWTSDFLQNASHVCRQHTTAYLAELKRNRPWATKMSDASGRYNGQFFFGNDFWLGSSNLCRELANAETNAEVPPFHVHFNVVKVHVNMAAHATRQIMVGLCLPSACSRQDLAGILTFDAIHANSRADNSSVNVVEVRRVPGPYSLLHDTKFFIVGGVSIAVAIVVAMATIYEQFIMTRDSGYAHSEVEATANNNNDSKRTDAISTRNEKDGHENRDKTKPIGVPARMLLCFSALSNGQKILKLDAGSEDSVRCVHGLRFLSVCWVILVHTYLQVFAIGENKTLRTVTERSFFYQSISNATFSVDSFFFISGLLVTLLYFRTARTKPSDGEAAGTLSVIAISAKRFLLLVFYRVMRLTPAYLFVLGLHELAMRYLHNNSVFEPNFYDHDTCAKYWWRNALYINTWYPQKEICMLWSWYMSNDTQFYVMAVLLLLMAVRSSSHLRAAGLLMALLLASSTVTAFLISYQYDYVVRIEQPFALFDQLYDKPWARVGPYLVGMATGWLLHATNMQWRVPCAAALLAWLAALSCLAALVYGVGRDGLYLPLSALYVSLGHTAWAIALGWITVACSTGHGGPVNSLLSFHGFLPFSRLTYCAYLLHPILMCITNYQMDGPFHLHNGVVLVLYFGNVIVAFLFAFVISLGFEAPIVRLLKMALTDRN